MNTKIASHAVSFVQVASAFAKRATDELTARRNAEKQAHAQLAETVELMLKAAAIKPEQKEAAASLLGSHAGTMQLLKKAVEKIAENKATKTAGDLGGPGDLETATGGNGEHELATQPVIGARNNQKRGSDLAFMRGLGLA